MFRLPKAIGPERLNTQPPAMVALTFSTFVSWALKPVEAAAAIAAASKYGTALFVDMCRSCMVLIDLCQDSAPAQRRPRVESETSGNQDSQPGGSMKRGRRRGP